MVLHAPLSQKLFARWRKTSFDLPGSVGWTIGAGARRALVQQAITAPRGMAVNSTSGDMCSLKFVTIKRRSDFRLQLPFRKPLGDSQVTCRGAGKRKSISRL